MNELVNGDGVATVTTVIVGVAVQDGLHGKVNLLRGCVPAGKADTIGKGRGGSENVTSTAL